MKEFDYKYFANIEDIKRFANSNDVTIVSILPFNGCFYSYVACFYKNEKTNTKNDL
jgi:hypothetical protein